MYNRTVHFVTVYVFNIEIKQVTASKQNVATDEVI